MSDHLPDGAAFDESQHVTQIENPPDDFERDKALGFLDDDDLSEEAKRQASEYGAGIARAINQWVVSSLQPSVITQRAVAVTYCLRREDLPPGLDKLPALAEHLGFIKQGLHFHVKAFREKFGIHILERSSAARANMSTAAIKAWRERQASEGELDETEAEDAD